jgi:hypothetical protein
MGGDLDLVSDMDIHTAVIVHHMAMDFLMGIPATTLRIMAIMRLIMGTVVMDMGDMDIIPIVITTDHITAAITVEGITVAGITAVTTEIVTVGRFKNNILTGAITAIEAPLPIGAVTEVTPDLEGIPVIEADIEDTLVPEVTQDRAFVDASY